ncbi:hypothetical protein FB565_007082 [Actinoplanes lutulentus]|uniref:WD40 repeat protein n=1 Tax=Actinoplanes lutulentus TaxID=1287878 RepID=A0A327ZAR8_9ACTN|nr:hypothetical protein [Actinoplanes lutulentus]MBB2947314.1 hypothetical protein [Actinoplanes lutulentus]RAK36589.1 hypothetical protein B0I29_108179 [Actinoplanes lutulentus]
MNNAFSADGRYLALMTQNHGGGSAILRADTATGDLTVVDVTEPGSADHFVEGNDLTLWAQAGLIVTKKAEVALLAYDVRTVEKRELIERFEPGYLYGHPAGSADGRHLFIAKHHLPKDETTHTIYLRIDLTTGAVDELLRDEGSANVHILAHPTDPDLLLIDRNYAPGWHGGSDGTTTRAWLLDARTGSLTECRPRNANNFQIHSNWSADGRFIYYHGLSGNPDQLPRDEKRGLRYDYTDRDWLLPMRGVDHYIGVSDLEGNVVWEADYPFFHYGHTSSHATLPAIIADGLLTPDLITAIHWQDLDSLGLPRTEILGRHGTYWKPGQQFDPHPVMSADGRYLSYNRGYQDGRSDVYLLQLEA